MGLFNVFKKKEKEKQESEENKFSPQIVKTDNVSHTLTEIAKKYNLSLSSLDFDILSIDTYVKLTKETDFVHIDDDTISLIQNKDLLLDKDLELKQSYEIRVKKFRFVDDFELIGKMKVDKYLTHSTYYVSPSSLLNFNNKLKDKIIEELKKKKIKSGMFIDLGFFESNLVDDVKKLIAKIRVLGSIDEEFPIELCKAKKPILPVRLKIIEHYKKHETTHHKELIYPIKRDEVVIEIIKPKEGHHGRNCRGELLKVQEFSKSEIPEFKINDDITKREDDDKIRYISNRNGYVYIKENVIMIRDELEINQISLKTGNIKGAEDSDVKLEVKESGVLKEAIKDGMIVETTELLVKGNVGNGAKIKAKKLEIDGQTHKGSKILAQNAEINAHKGYLKANTALINRLEGGVVEAKNVHISQAISGKVIAKEIKIDILGSHLTLIASDLIEIENFKGNENHLVINEAVVAHQEEYVKKMEENYKNLEIKIRHYKEKLLNNRKIIKNNQESIEIIKSKIKEKREKKEVVNPTFIQKLKKFNDFVKKTKLIESEIKNLLEKQKNIKYELEKIQNGVFLAKIISHSGFNEFNRIEFQLTEPPMKISYDTRKSDEFKNIFTLKDYGEMEYKIVGEEE